MSQEFIKTGHSTKNYVVVKTDRYTICKSYGTEVARFSSRGFIEFSPLWDYSPTTIRHVQWFLKEIRKWGADVSIKNLRRYVDRSHPHTFVPIVDFIDDVYRVR